MKKQIELQSKDGKTSLNCLKWLPAEPQQPVAILQIIHGMAEYIERYDEFATFLASHNIIVVGHDHLGHGLSVSNDAPLHGYFSEHDSEDILVEDAHQLTIETQRDYPTLPYFILGHSMGSFILRNYLKKHSQGLAGAIIMGTGSRRPELKAALLLTKTLNKLAPRKVNRQLDSLAFGSFANHFPENSSSFDWLSKDPENVERYIADPLLGFVFTNNGFNTLFNLMQSATQKGWWQEISPNLPLYIISGEQDPVGNFGKGPREVALELTEADFQDVTLQLYSTLRHEILNESEKDVVMTDIWEWLQKQLTEKSDTNA